MKIEVRRWGGASAGIFGQAGADSDMTNSLKRIALAFATEYRKSTADKDEIMKLSNDMEGLIQTLIVTNTLSESEAIEIIDQLHFLIKNIQK